MQSAINLLTVEQYLELEQTNEIRHEYLGGQVFAMSGSSKKHNLITGNIITLLSIKCDVFLLKNHVTYIMNLVT